MIQRIQSLFLLLAAIIPLVLLFLPIGYVNTEEAQYVYNTVVLKLNIPDGHAVVRVYYVAFCLVLCSAMSIVSLFTYKNRVRQTQFVSITMVVYLITLMVMLWICPDIIFKKYFLIIDMQYDFQFAHKVLLLFLIIAEAVFLYLANRFIKKDEELVRAADRLR